MTRPSDRAIAQAFWELVESQLFLPNPQMDAVLTMIDRDARTIDATAAPVVVGEDKNADLVRALRRIVAVLGPCPPRSISQGAKWEWEDALSTAQNALTAALAGD